MNNSLKRKISQTNKMLKLTSPKLRRSYITSDSRRGFTCLTELNLLEECDSSQNLKFWASPS